MTARIHPAPASPAALKLAPRKTRRTKTPALTAEQAAARTLEIARRAAELFGQSDSGMFPRAQVTGAELKAAIRRTLQQVVGVLPPVLSGPNGLFGPHSEALTVTFGGTTAFCKHDWLTWNAPIGVRPQARALLNLPAIGDSERIARTHADSWITYALHELAHAITTNPDVYRSAIRDLSAKHGTQPKVTAAFLNCVEDAAIERELIASGVVAGFPRLVTALASTHVERMLTETPDIAAQIAAGSLSAFPFLLAFGLRVTPNPYIGALLDALPLPLRAIYDRAAASFATLPPRDTVDGLLQGTANVAALVDRVLSELAELPRGKSGAGGILPPQDGDNGDGEAADGEGDGEAAEGEGEGDAGDGEPTDGDAGDGEPTDGDAGDGEPTDGDAGDGEAADGDGDGDGEAADGEPTDGDAGDGEPTDGDAGDGEAAEGDGEPTDGDAGDGEPTDGDAGDGEPTDAPAPADAPAADGGGDGFGLHETLGELTADSMIDAEMLPTGLDGERDTVDAAAETLADVTRQSARIRNVLKAASDYETEWQRGRMQKAMMATPRLLGALRSALSRSDVYNREGGYRSGRLSATGMIRAACGSDDVFERRSVLSGVDSAVSVLVDCSGSMSGPRLTAARDTAAVLTTTLARCSGVRTAVYSFTTGSHNDDVGNLGRALRDAAREDDLELGLDQVTPLPKLSSVSVERFKTFNEQPAALLGRIMHMHANGGTPTCEALQIVADDLAKQSAGRRVLILITDGDDGRPALLAKVVNRIMATGTIVLAIGIGSDVCTDAFPHAATVNSAAELGGATVTAMLRAIAAEHGDLDAGDA